MYQVNTKYCLRKVCLDSLHPSPMGALVSLYEILLYKTAARCPLYPVFPSLCASGVGLKFFLGAESFSRSLPAQMSQVAAVPLERGGSGIRSSCPRGSLCFWFAQTWTTMGDTGRHPFTPTGIASIWNEDGNGMKLCMITMTYHEHVDR